MNHRLKLISDTGRHTWIDLSEIAFAAVGEPGKITIVFKNCGATLVIPDTPHFTEPFERYWGFRQ